MKTANFTVEALDAATDEQIDAVARLLRGDSSAAMDVHEGGFGLPNGYLAFRLDYEGGGSMYGGIDPDGSVST